MEICVRRHANVSKQAMLLDGLDVSTLKWLVCGCGLNQFVHEGMNHISNVEVYLKTCSGNVNIKKICEKKSNDILIIDHFVLIHISYLILWVEGIGTFLITPHPHTHTYFSLE